jgi:hypothetical protein
MADNSKQSDPHSERSVRMQRVRVGLTGLAIILLIVALSTIIYTRFNRQANLVSAGTAPTAAVENGTQVKPDEPLAQLGVLPGTGVSAGNATKPPAPANGQRKP